jgi:hypothetical protein
MKFCQSSWAAVSMVLLLLPMRRGQAWLFRMGAQAPLSSRLFQSTAARSEAEVTTTNVKIATSSRGYNVYLAPPNRDGITKVLADDKDFVKPDPDLRKYRWIQLANNLQALLVSTTETTDGEEEEQSHVEAAAVHVQAGHFDDTIPGVSAAK